MLLLPSWFWPPSSNRIKGPWSCFDDSSFLRMAGRIFVFKKARQPRMPASWKPKHSVDGRNPKANHRLDVQNLVNNGINWYTTYQLLQDFSHQQYQPKFHTLKGLTHQRLNCKNWCKLGQVEVGSHDISTPLALWFARVIKEHSFYQRPTSSKQRLALSCSLSQMCRGTRWTRTRSRRVTW